MGNVDWSDLGVRGCLEVSPLSETIKLHLADVLCSHLRYSKADMLRANSLYVSKIVAPERDWPASIMPLSLARK